MSTTAVAAAAANEESSNMESKGVKETRELLSDLCRHFYTLGWVSGTGGSITIKVHDDSIPKSQQLIVMSPSDNLHLELDVVKPEMVEPSSGDVPTVGGDLHSVGDHEPGANQGSMEEIDVTNPATAYLNKKSDGADAGSSEKLNLDRSSGDDSLEEDVMDSKQIDSNHNSDEAVDISEPIGSTRTICRSPDPEQ